MAPIRTAALSIVICGTTLLGMDRTVYAADIVIPNALTSTDGNDGGTTGTLFRMQEIYAASEFSVFNSPLLISAIAFRPDVFTRNTFSITNSGLQINFSTTGRSPDGLSTTFADNVGPDDTVVRSGPIALSTANTGPDAGPRDFDIIIALTNPFLYNPSVGNLLVDFRSVGQLFPFSITGAAPVDAVNVLGDPMSLTLGGLNSLTGEATTFAFVTRFTVSPVTVTAVPEPTTLLLVGTGLALVRKRIAWHGRSRA